MTWFNYYVRNSWRNSNNASIQIAHHIKNIVSRNSNFFLDQCSPEHSRFFFSQVLFNQFWSSFRVGWNLFSGKTAKWAREEIAWRKGQKDAQVIKWERCSGRSKFVTKYRLSMLRDDAQGQMEAYLIRSLQIFHFACVSLTASRPPALMTTWHVNTTQNSTLQIREDGRIRGYINRHELYCTDAFADIATSESKSV